MLGAAVFLCAEEHAKFKRHVKTRQGRFSIGFCPRDVMNAVTAFFDDLADFLEAIVRVVICFKRATRHKSGANDRKNNGVEEKLIAIVEGTVDEHIAVRIRHLAASGLNFD